MPSSLEVAIPVTAYRETKCKVIKARAGLDVKYAPICLSENNRTISMCGYLQSLSLKRRTRNPSQSLAPGEAGDGVGRKLMFFLQSLWML